jgi:D-amino peptidase
MDRKSICCPIFLFVKLIWGILDNNSEFIKRRKKMKRAFIFLGIILFVLFISSSITYGEQATKGLKVFIVSDHGIGSVVSDLQATPGRAQYQTYRHLMTEEVNAAIRSALAVGAIEIMVTDSHANLQNIIVEELHPIAKLVRGGPRPLCMMEGIDESFDAVIFIGGHARTGTRYAVREHSFGHDYLNIWVNNILVNEFIFDSMIAGYFDVPVVLATGDEAFTRQMEEFLPNIETVSVMKGVGQGAITIHPSKSRALIEQKTSDSLKRLSSFKPAKLTPPYTLKIEFAHVHFAELVSWIPGVRLENDRTISFTTEDFLQIPHLLQVIMNLNYSK